MARARLVFPEPLGPMRAMTRDTAPSLHSRHVSTSRKIERLPSLREKSVRRSDRISSSPSGMNPPSPRDTKASEKQCFGCHKRRRNRVGRRTTGSRSHQEFAEGRYVGLKNRRYYALVEDPGP